MLNLEKCIVCGSSQFEPFLVCKDYTVSQENFNIVSCKSCGFKFTNPRPENSVIGDYYKAEEYVSHSNTTKGVVNKLYHSVRNYTLKQKLKLISSYVSRGTMLDYGCGTGMFLNVCKNDGWETYGMEPDDNARKTSIEKGLDVFSDKNMVSDRIADKKFNAITLWHVLEHVTDMEATLSFFKSKLNNDGVLIIAVPNHVSYDAKYYKEFWAAYDVPRHLHHFDINSMTSLVEKAGFKFQESKPMMFDSFYVSMLSEKYKTGSVNLVKAFLVGLTSNFKAKDTHSYSSTIYIFKHK
jgi:2-polyprenyl-3-methyl-5-hydroxy-6-metoxy-1,4-benzoquinol methylase